MVRKFTPPPPFRVKLQNLLPELKLELRYCKRGLFPIDRSLSLSLCMCVCRCVCLPDERWLRKWKEHWTVPYTRMGECGGQTKRWGCQRLRIHGLNTQPPPRRPTDPTRPLPNHPSPSNPSTVPPRLLFNVHPRPLTKTSPPPPFLPSVRHKYLISVQFFAVKMWRRTPQIRQIIILS